MRSVIFSAWTVAIVPARPIHSPPPTKEALSSLVADIIMENKTLIEYFFPANGTTYVPDARVNWRRHTEHCHVLQTGCYCGHVLGSKVKALNRIAPGSEACESLTSHNLLKREMLRANCSRTFLAKSCPCITGMGEPCLYSDMTPTTTIAMISLARAAGVNHIIEEGREGGLSSFLYSLHGFQVTSVEYLPELEVSLALSKLAPSVRQLDGDGSKLLPQLIGEMTQLQASRTLVIFDGEKRIKAYGTFSKMRSKVALAAFDDSNQPGFRSFLEGKKEIWWETGLDTAAKPLLKLRDQFAARDDFGFNVQVGTATTFVVGGGWRKVPPR
jgi:hypothetical protein